jgi:redox-sensitive bicupin YhaK (pirin superfamily)
MSDPILQTIAPVTHDLGGFKVHRTLPSRERTMVGPFIFFDQMGPAKLEPGTGIDVRPHPHIGLATVTYLFDGAIAHRDSLGTYARIEPGAVNLMTAGAGIVHSERSPQELRAEGPVLSGLQTWLALPLALEETTPDFEHTPANALPAIESDGASVRLVMGEAWGQRSPVTCHSPTIYADIQLAVGASLPIDAGPEERALYLVAGDATVEGNPLASSHLTLLKPGLAATLRSNGGARVMLAGGAAMDGARHVWWNFVSSSRDRIVQARADWKAQRFGTVPGDDKEFIPLPEVPKTVSYP